MDYQNICFSIKDRVGRITLARPPLNILNISMMREIGECLNECMAARDMVAIVFDAVPLPRIIGEKRARELILTGELIDAQEAARLVLITSVVPASELEQKTEEL